MDFGAAVRQRLEVEEAIRFLRGESVADDLRDATLSVTAAMLRVADPALETARRAEGARVVESGDAFERFAAMVRAHGGDVAALERPACWRLHRSGTKCARSGGVRPGDPRADRRGDHRDSGRAEAGGGEDRSSAGTGSCPPRDLVERGSLLAVIHARDGDDALHAAARLLPAYRSARKAGVPLDGSLEHRKRRGREG